MSTGYVSIPDTPFEQSKGVSCYLYAHIGVGFCVARSTVMGNAKA